RGVQSASRGVPERERSQAVGVDVLGGLLKFSELRQSVAGVGVEGVIHLQQQGAIALDNKRVGCVYRHGVLLQLLDVAIETLIARQPVLLVVRASYTVYTPGVSAQRVRYLMIVSEAMAS